MYREQFDLIVVSRLVLSSALKILSSKYRKKKIKIKEKKNKKILQ